MRIGSPAHRAGRARYARELRYGRFPRILARIAAAAAVTAAATVVAGAALLTGASDPARAQGFPVDESLRRPLPGGRGSEPQAPAKGGARGQARSERRPLEPAPTVERSKSRPGLLSKDPLAQVPASVLGRGFVAGVFPGFSFDEQLADWPAGRVLTRYVKLDDPSNVSTFIDQLEGLERDHPETLRRLDLQIPIEIVNRDFGAFRAALADPRSDASDGIRRLAGYARAASTRRAWRGIWLRPLSEMNDGTHPWELRNRRGPTPEQFAQGWLALKRRWQERDRSARWVFCVLAGGYVSGHDLVEAALRRIPRGGIDAIGYNIYARPRGSRIEDPPSDALPIPAAELVSAWQRIFRRTGHWPLPQVAPEWAVSRQATDAHRARWIRESAATLGRSGFAWASFFSGPESDWWLTPGSQAGRALSAEMARLGGSPYIR